MEGLTPADVAKERRDQLAALPVPKNPDAEAEVRRSAAWCSASPGFVWRGAVLSGAVVFHVAAT